MTTQPECLSTNVAPEIIHLSSVTVRDKMGGEHKAHLEVEKNNGLLIISANYNSSPIPNEDIAAKFYLTQDQLDEFLVKGKKCVLIVPDKN